MKTIILLAVSLVVASAFQYQAEWEAWKATYEKTYESDMVALHRQMVWESNRLYVKNHNENADKFKFTLSMNEFADLVIWPICMIIFLILTFNRKLMNLLKFTMDINLI